MVGQRGGAGIAKGRLPSPPPPLVGGDGGCLLRRRLTRLLGLANALDDVDDADLRELRAKEKTKFGTPNRTSNTREVRLGGQEQGPEPAGRARKEQREE